jgi:rhodanese-related sulfurtransferase
MDVPEVDPIEAIRLLNESGAVMLDVREDDEWSAGHAPGAIHVPLSVLDARSFDTTVPVVAACRSGKRSSLAANQLAAAGVTVYNLAGGMKAWLESGHPVISDDFEPAIII